MTKQIFAIQMLYLYEYLSIPPDQGRNRKYWDLMGHLTDEQFSNAVKNVIKEFVPTSTVPFPLVAHFLRYCGQGSNDGVCALGLLKIAVQRVGRYNSVSFNDPALHHVIRSCGGWAAVCAMTDKDWNINEGRMLEIYKTAQYSNIEAPDHCQGLAELEEGKFTLTLIPPSGYQDKKELLCNGSVKEFEAKQLTEGKHGQI